jgi:hypothetical protein
MTYSNWPPNLTKFSYSIALPPAGAKVSAWDKLKEVERWLAMYRWAESENDPGAAQHRVLLNCMVSAFLLSFEATIQFLKQQWCVCSVPLNFDQWLKAQPEHDLTVRAVRTLRHFEAHVEVKPIPRHIDIRSMNIVGGAGTTKIQVDSTWHLPGVSNKDLQGLKRPALVVSDLPDWQLLAASTTSDSRFEHALRQLAAILVSAEAMLH